MSLSTWGPPIWTFFHTLAARVKESEFERVKSRLIDFIVQVCRNLPCPTCSAHSGDILRKVNFANIKSKQDFKNIIFLFHNIVNKSKQKPLFNYSLLDSTYDKTNLIDSYNKFVSVYQTRGNLRAISDNFHRSHIVAKLKLWIETNINSFERV